MKKLLSILTVMMVFLTINGAEVYSSVIIDKKDIVGIYQDTTGARIQYFMVYYYKGLKAMTSISKTEVQRYHRAIKYGISYTVVVEQLKTKKRVRIVTYGDERPKARSSLCSD